MHSRPLLLIHGYGVRSYFWNALQPHLAEQFHPIETPDLELPDVESGVALVGDACRALRHQASQPVVLVGHSLGGILAALAARDLASDTVSHLVVIASPYGHRRRWFHTGAFPSSQRIGHDDFRGVGPGSGPDRPGNHQFCARVACGITGSHLS